MKGLLIDSHVHLNDGTIYPRVSEVIADAMKEAVGEFVCIGYDRFFSERALAIAREYPNVYAAIGFHPECAHEVADADLDWLVATAKDEKVVAIGEIGLDYYWDKSQIEAQKSIFIRQIEIANDLNLPISVHMREAVLDTYLIIKQYKRHDLPGVMHCYSGSPESLTDFLDLNMYISLGGPVTFKNARVPKAVAAKVPLERLLIETDSPYLAPQAVRGKPNEPKYLHHIAREIASIRGLTFEEVASATSENARMLFGI